MNERKADIRSALALLVTIGGGVLLKIGDNELRLLVGSMMTIVLSFYFGTSQSSKAKDETISKLQDAQTDAAKVLAEKVPPRVNTPTQVEVVNDKPVDVKVVKP